MNEGVAAQIRLPSKDELKRMRELWAALKQKSLPASTDIGIELQTYLAHAVRTIGIIAGLHPITGEPALTAQFPLPVSKDGPTRLHDSVQLCSAILSLWTTDKGTAPPKDAP
ncbi:MAG: hypothetical protein JWQ87_3712 [Candidatus Sulfotelmatobacter sp.]|jgi:hypothetical protein|nr:hypothetical protein [Candidatus Sulfotelmatobacter sp.]